MIFVAVGTQLAFDRLIKYMDEWAKENDEKVIAQIAEGEYLPKYIEYKRYMSGDVYNQYIQEARIFVSHAGMGNIFTAKELNKPIIVMNRQFKLQEHRNDHQTDGLIWMSKLDEVYAATTQEELIKYLENIDLSAQGKKQEKNNSSKLTDFIASFIRDKKVK